MTTKNLTEKQRLGLTRFGGLFSVTDGGDVMDASLLEAPRAMRTADR